MKDFQNIKIVLIFLVILILQSNSMRACNYPFCLEDKIYKLECDLCSCSTGSGSIGFGTLSSANFVGIRYIYQNFESKDGIFSNSPTINETFSTYQLWAQIPINENFIISGNLPYQNLKRAYSNRDETIKGIGDVSLMGWYKFIFYKKQSDNLVPADKVATGHSLKFGLGIKLPTGDFEEYLADNINPGFQVGTGSVDGVFSLGYSYGGKKYGVNTLFSYYAKGENKNEYQFGNQVSYSVNLFRAFSTKKMNIMPFIGFSGDGYDKITQYGETLADTNGNIFNASIGSELVVDKFIFGGSYAVPVEQNLFGNNVKAKQRLSFYVNYAL